MSLWSRFPFVRITLAMAGGILTAHYCEGWEWWIPGVLLVIVTLVYVLVVMLVPLSKYYTWSPLLGVLGLGSIFLLGHWRFQISEVQRAPDHLTNLSGSVVAYEAIALEDTAKKSKSCSVVVAVCRARVKDSWRQVQGKVRLSFPHDTLPYIRYGDILLVLGSPSVIPPSMNPQEFDSAAFLGLSQVYHQHFVQSELIVIGHHVPNLIQSWSLQFLHYCQAIFSKHIHEPAALAVVQALVLGQKDALTPAIQSSYAGTGTMHVLAVSGLHVGILYWLVSFFMSFLRPLPYIRLLSPILSLVILWFYAFVTGLSPSVLRATLMFTLLLLAPMMYRQSNIYNTLAASAFFLLLWNPRWLFSVSFQLSYVAVMGIVYLQPRIYSWFSIRRPFLNKLWVWTSVSLAAQIATSPISVYYFHQFPVYFLIANWVVVPAALLILCLGLLVLATGCWPGLSGMIAWVLEKVVEGVNAFVAYIQALPDSVIDDIHLSITIVLLLYGFLLLWLLFWYTRRLRYGVLASIIVILLSLHMVYTHLTRREQCQVTFYSIGNHQVIGFVKGYKSTLCVDNRFKDLPDKYAYHVQPNQLALGISSKALYTFDEAIQNPDFPLQTWQGLQIAVWQGKRFVFVNQVNLPPHSVSTKIHTDFLVVEDNALETLLPLLDRFIFNMLVIGRRNTAHIAEQLQAEAAQQGLRSHSLRQQGALVVSW